MGAHTLGGAAPPDSGYAGPWVPGPGEFAFDNVYYRSMIDANINWAAVDKDPLSPGVAAPKWQFDGTTGVGGPRLMLNTDFEVFYDVTLDASGQPLCGVNINALTCSAAATNSLATSYANVSGFEQKIMK